MQELREARHRNILAHEQTKKEVANLLHAQVQSRLLVLEYWLKNCEESLNDRPSDVRSLLGEARSVLGEIIDHDLRTIIRQLYPAIIRTGLPCALNSLSDRFQKLMNVEINIDSPLAEIENSISPGLHDDVRLTLYRVAEEALTNAAKHSGASKVRIFLGFCSPREIYLHVQDDGCGFDSSNYERGHGVLSMEEYAEGMDGVLEVDSLPGQGTTVRLRVPMLEKSRPDYHDSIC